MSNKLKAPVKFMWSRADGLYAITDKDGWTIALVGSKEDAKLICTLINNEHKKVGDVG